MAGVATFGAAAALILWPVKDPEVLPHVHQELPDDHPHLRDATRHPDGYHHAHTYVIDDEHLCWPTAG
jgi:hypothetical protein